MPSHSANALHARTLPEVMRGFAPRISPIHGITWLPMSVSDTGGLLFLGPSGTVLRRPGMAVAASACRAGLAISWGLFEGVGWPGRDACAVGVLVLPAGGKSACAGFESREGETEMAWSLVLPWRPKKGSVADGRAPGPGVCSEVISCVARSVPDACPGSGDSLANPDRASPVSG